jgi:alpha-1,3-rhamnosyl/mannosyltransferase
MNVILAVDPIVPTLTGIGRYTWELTQRLPPLAGIDDLRFFGFGRWIENPGDLLSVGPATSAVRQKLAASQLAVWLYGHVAPLISWNSLRGFNDYLYHSPNFFLPPFAGLRVATFHDLSVYRYPEFHPPARVTFMRREIPKALRRANHIIAVSQFVAGEITNYLDFPSERISVVPNGVSASYHPCPAEMLRSKLSEYTLEPGRYALCVSTIEPRKNITILLEAYARLPSSLRQRYPLVLCGDKGWRSEVTHDAIDRAQRAGWLIYLGFTPEGDLPLLYAGARLFAFPSLHEGFGLPVLEAMACGIPVVASNRSAIPEVTQDAALLVEPQERDALTEALRQGLQDKIWRERAIQRGLQCAKACTWDACAARTRDVYAQVIAATEPSATAVNQARGQ